MYGSSVGSLNFYVNTGAGLGQLVWTRTGSQGNQWTKAAVTISQGRRSYSVRFLFVCLFVFYIPIYNSKDFKYYL